ncbi:uncharacterized [Tachysurus ichikawai]
MISSPEWSVFQDVLPPCPKSKDCITADKADKSSRMASPAVTLIQRPSGAPQMPEQRATLAWFHRGIRCVPALIPCANSPRLPANQQA